MLLKFPLMMLLAGLVWAVTSLVCVSDARAVADPVDLYVEAMLDADVESLDRLLASNFIFIGSNGHVQDKEHFLQTIAQKKLIVHKASFKNLRESSAGPVRLVTGNGVFTAVSDVPLPSGLMRVSLVSDCTGKRERIVLVQLTPVIPTAQCEDGNCLIR